MDTALAFNPTLAVPRNDNRGKDLPPALVEAIRDDPAMIGPMARVYGATVLHDMFVLSKTFTPAQQKDFVDLCAKLGDMVPKQKVDAQAAGAQFSIQINIPAVEDNPATSRVIEAQYEAVQLPEILGGVSEKRPVHQSGVRPDRIDEDNYEPHQDTD